MRMCHFRVQNGPFVLNKMLLEQTIIITFTYLLAFFVVQKLKNFLQRIQSYEDVSFLGPKMVHFSKWEFFQKTCKMSLVFFIHVYLHAKNQS